MASGLSLRVGGGLASAPVVEQFVKLYEWAAGDPPGATADCSGQLQPVAEAVAAALGLPSPSCIGDPCETAAPELRRSHVVLLFSGGKDSLAAALKLRARGMRVGLLHATGINGGSYRAKEREAAQRLAQGLRMPLCVVGVDLVGRGTHIENPTKNFALAAIGAALAANSNAAFVSLGLLESARGHRSLISAGLSDDTGLCEIAGKAIEAISGVRFISALHANMTDSYRTVWQTARHLLPEISSCMLGPRAFRATREANQRKLGVELMPGRCGSCYKCAMELVTLAALEGERLPELTARHCIAKMRSGFERFIAGRKVSEAEALEGLMEPAVIEWRAALGLWAQKKPRRNAGARG